MMGRMDATSLIIGFAVGLAIAGAWAFTLRARVAAGAAAVTAAEARAALLETQSATLARRLDEQRSLDSALQPVAERIEAVARAAIDADRRRVEAEAGIRAELEHLRTGNDHLGSATRQLVAAMSKGQSRGRWGEMQLEQLLVHAGLVEGVHFHRQHSRTTADGLLRPDLAIEMPGGGEVLVDAKFPWDAFFEAMALEDPALQAPLLDKHSRDLLARVQELARKDYASTATTSPDFVVLFLPLEPLLSTALDRDGLLLERAFERRVIPATPTTMLGLLRTIGFAWSRHDLAVNAEEIRDLSREMLARLGTMLGHLNDTGDQLRRAVDSYNRLIGSFDTRVVTQARRIADLGVPSAPLDVRAPIDEGPRQARTELSPP